jgi:hypothetical protein
MKRGANEKQAFERLEISKEDLIRLFGVRDPLYKTKTANFTKMINNYPPSKVQSIQS